MIAHCRPFLSILLLLCSHQGIRRLFHLDWHLNLSAAVAVAAPPTFSPTISNQLPQPLIYPDETVNILSVTIRMVSESAGSSIHYSLDGSTPTKLSPSIASDAPLFIDSIGTFTVKCFVESRGALDSAISVKTYTILDRCAVPQVYPSGGSYPGSVTVTLSSVTEGAKICYTLSTTPNNTVQCVPSGGTVLLDRAGSYTMITWTTVEGKADSTTVSTVYNVLAQVEAPAISPTLSTFAISATLMLSCPTPGAQIYYTVDGSEPSESSLVVEDGQPVVVTGTGVHLLKAFAVKAPMLPSDVTTKAFTIQERLSQPKLVPPPGHFVGDLLLRIDCPDGAAATDEQSEAQALTTVYYTTDGVATPTQHSKHVLCGEIVRLEAPGTTVVRAIEMNPYKSSSGVTQGEYTLVRPPYDEWPVRSARGGSFQVGPDVELLVVERDITQLRCPDRSIRGRLLKLKNPVGHFSVLPPLDGCSSGKLELPSISGRWFTPGIGFNLTAFVSMQQAFPSQLQSRNSVQHLRGHQSDDIRIKSAKAAAMRSDIEDMCIADDPLFPLVSANASISFKSDKLADVPDFVVNSLRLKSRDSHIEIDLQKLLDWSEQYKLIKSFGCEVVTNAGFFNTETNTCIGNVVSDGKVHQLSESHNVNFGIRNGSFIMGYVEKDEILSKTSPRFDVLISGLGWLVRYGKSYVSESFSRNGDAEDMSGQSTGNNFITVLSARTAIGHDRDGNLLILQVEGETWARGMNLYEFADLAVDLGFYSAINLDGGGSATMTQNHTLISEPSWKCPDAPYNSSDLYRCEKRVASITCVHAMAPPFIDAQAILDFIADSAISQTQGESSVPSNAPSQHPSTLHPTTPSPSTAPSQKPSFYDAPTTAEYYYDDGNTYTYSYDDTLDGTGSHETGDDAASGIESNSTMLGAAILNSPVLFYQACTLTLGIMLVCSIALHFGMCCYYRRKLQNSESSKAPTDHQYDGGAGSNSSYDNVDGGYNGSSNELATPTAVHDPANYLHASSQHGIQLTRVQTNPTDTKRQHRQLPFSLFGSGGGGSQYSLAQSREEDGTRSMDSSQHPDGSYDQTYADIGSTGSQLAHDEDPNSEEAAAADGSTESQSANWRERLMNMNYDDDSDDGSSVEAQSVGKQSHNGITKLNKTSAPSASSRLRRPRKTAHQSDSSASSTVVEDSSTVELYGQDRKPLIAKKPKHASDGKRSDGKLKSVSVVQSKKQRSKSSSVRESDDIDDAEEEVAALLQNKGVDNTASVGKSSKTGAISSAVSSVTGKMFGKRKVALSQQQQQDSSDSSMGEGD